MNIDEEIMQDFLVEAGELYDLLNDQLTELESNAEDEDVLNAVFRAFHTIKGGAGFMKLTPMVEVCHRAEDVFDLLRNKAITVDAGLIDVMFQVLDILGDMFESIREGEEQESASPELLQKLDGYLNKDKPAAVAIAVEETNAVKTAAVETANDTNAAVSMDDEFEQMRQAAIDAKQTPDTTPANSNAGNSTVNSTGQSDLITDDEFDNLLDEIHGKGKHQLANNNAAENKTAEVPAADDGLITDDEFEAMLDQMHGKNKGPTTQAEESAQAVVLVEPAKPAESVTPSVAPAEAVSEEKEAKVEPEKENKSAKKSAKKQTIQKESSVRVDTERLDDIMNLVGELVLVKNRLSTLKQTIKHESIEGAITTLELVTSDLQSSVMKTRMQPIKKVFSRFPRVIRDLAKQLNKDINLELIGENTDLDKSLVEALADPLIHLVRNSADHGIEAPDERFGSGKSRQGTVTLSAKQEGDQILLTVSDDGKGMDATVFKRKAVESGLMSETDANNMTDKESFNLIFAPGFSTKTEISDVSGRGVGMDVVKTRINELNGSIEIDSKLGEGSVITIYLPLTLAILPTLMIKLDDHQFALPLTNVYETFNMKPEKINIVDGQDVIRIRDTTLPLFYLHPWLVRENNFDGPKVGHKVLVIQMGGSRLCLVVDQIIGQEEVVIKPLGKILNDVPGFSGATITGDGGIALVLDMPSLMGEYASNCLVH